MTLAFYTNVISPHQLPLAREVARRLGGENVCYVHREEMPTERVDLGWAETPIGCRVLPAGCGEADRWLREADVVLMGGHRDFSLAERRANAGKRTLYMSERWFKPLRFLPGWLRLLHPSYLLMVRRFLRLVSRDEFRVLTIGPHATTDFRMIGVPDRKMMPWGYFVSPSEGGKRDSVSRELRVLWVGRMLRWKCVDTLLEAVAVCRRQMPVHLTLVGDGPERKRLVQLARALGLTSVVEFLPSRSVTAIREIMRANDLYVLASDANEGWGAVVNEALEEGLCVLGTAEAGASAELLPKDHLFSAGDVKALARLMERADTLSPNEIGPWTASWGAERLLEACRCV